MHSEQMRAMQKPSLTQVQGHAPHSGDGIRAEQGLETASPAAPNTGPPTSIPGPAQALPMTDHPPAGATWDSEEGLPLRNPSLKTVSSRHQLPTTAAQFSFSQQPGSENQSSWVFPILFQRKN